MTLLYIHLHSKCGQPNFLFSYFLYSPTRRTLFIPNAQISNCDYKIRILPPVSTNRADSIVFRNIMLVYIKCTFELNIENVLI